MEKKLLNFGIWGMFDSVHKVNKPQLICNILNYNHTNDTCWYICMLLSVILYIISYPACKLTIPIMN